MALFFPQFKHVKHPRLDIDSSQIGRAIVKAVCKYLLLYCMQLYMHRTGFATVLAK
jgi:hypothetical protein